MNRDIWDLLVIIQAIFLLIVGAACAVTALYCVIWTQDPFHVPLAYMAGGWVFIEMAESLIDGAEK